jgi:hypothetical protein
VLNEYGVEFLSVHGFASATKIRELAVQIQTDERLTVILYLGDLSIPENRSHSHAFHCTL